ncbi:MAG: ABC transporter permease [Candidatus Omnitrophica bacterium]|nr:ABC transporter permease [Candidatus Omnitrophota bacterium]MCA9425406.1 ABC transporter permease [Candidatus Omnitrophota bacterium]MCA9446531.1 ABC transporter permease [Candidatus Omnitrophota bacterium]MCB9768129.1 ABC transporter permease [Candidatus Omnitrophota bacterium]
MRILEDLLAGCEGLARNKMRSMLSALGIVIAVGSVVMIVTLGDQAKKLIILELERRWGADLVIIENAPPQRYRHWLDDWKNLKDEDLAAVRRKIDYVEFIGGLRESRSKQVVYGSEHVMGNLKEVDPDYLEARGRIVREGRNLTWSDQENALKVCTIGAELAQELFDTEENAINQEVRITGQRFKVIGVVDPKAEQVGNSEFAKDIYIPLSTGGRRFSGDDPLDEIVIKTHGSYNTERVLTEVADILFQRHGDWDFFAYTEQERIQGIQNIVTMVQSILAALAAISLVVGGIVVMNMMLVSVTERTPEIGLRKALGARRRDIIFQFLFETLALCLLSGLVGLAGGLGMAYLVREIVPRFVTELKEWPWVVEFTTLSLALTCSTLVGLISGLYPAWRAAKLDATVALRYE